MSVRSPGERDIPPKPKKPFVFSEKLQETHERRKLLDESFYPLWAYRGRFTPLEGSTGSDDFNRRMHVDVSIQINDVRTLLLDEKLDTKRRSTIFAETVSAKEHRTPGWMVPGISTADLLLWSYPLKRPHPGQTVYVLWFPMFKTWFWTKRRTTLMFEEYEIPNSNKERTRFWTTVGESVPLDVIPSEMFLVFKHDVLLQQRMF